MVRKSDIIFDSYRDKDAFASVMEMSKVGGSADSVVKLQVIKNREKHDCDDCGDKPHIRVIRKKSSGNYYNMHLCFDCICDSIGEWFNNKLNLIEESIHNYHSEGQT